MNLVKYFKNDLFLVCILGIKTLDSCI